MSISDSIIKDGKRDLCPLRTATGDYITQHSTIAICHTSNHWVKGYKRIWPAGEGGHRNQSQEVVASRQSYKDLINPTSTPLEVATDIVIRLYQLLK